MKIVKHLFTVIIISSPLTGFADELSVGTISCKEWLEDRSTDTSYINKSVDQSWLIGFLSAYSETTRINFLTNIQTKNIYNWMDKYCAGHPKKNIDEGALILAHQLTDRVKNAPIQK